MATITWTIAQLERNATDGGVVIAHYRVNGVDGEYTQGAYGTYNFEPDPSAEGFVAFDDLTEATVIQWIKDGFGAEKVTEIENAITAKIEEQKNPVVVAGMPWVTEEPTE